MEVWFITPLDLDRDLTVGPNGAIHLSMFGKGPGDAPKWVSHHAGITAVRVTTEADSERVPTDEYAPNI